MSSKILFCVSFAATKGEQARTEQSKIQLFANDNNAKIFSAQIA
jgi:hypothetical protein